MSQHRLPRLIGCILLLAIITGRTLAAEGTKAWPPNIVYLMTDDQTDVATGCYGNKQVKTPQMDRLARDGIRFRNHYNTTAICMASRVCVMTGLYEYRHGCNFMHGDLPYAKFLKSYPVLLRKAGYFTGFAGKIGFSISGKSFDDFGDHFDIWGGGRGQTKYQTARNPRIAQYARKYPHSSRAYAAWANDFMIAAKKTGKPFCLSISFKAPHLPFTPDKKFDDVYRDLTWVKPLNYGKKNAAHLAPQAKTGRQYNGYKFWRKSDATYQEAMRGYNQLIHGVDVALGMIRKSLETHGLAKNTIIIFTSDNGYSCGAHGFGGKVLPYEEASRSPLIFYDPRQPKSKRGQERTLVTGNIDMAPTIIELAGLSVPKECDGVSLRLELQKAGSVKRKSIALTNLWGNREIQEMAVVTPEWKYIYWSYESKTMRPTEELFHVAKDRREIRNLAGAPEHAAKLKEMRAMYDRHFAHLKSHVVDYNRYGLYKTLFDRKATLKDKAALLEKIRKRKRKPKRRKFSRDP